MRGEICIGYWEKKEQERCRLCGWEEESWKHAVKVCIREGKGEGRERILEYWRKMEGKRDG